MTSALLALLAFADLGLAPARAEEPPPAYATALEAAEALHRQGDTEAARALAAWIAAQPDAGPARDAALALDQSFAADRRPPVWPKVRLIGWEAAYGAFSLGLAPALGGWFDGAEALYPTAALVGGGLGATGGWLLTRRDGFGTNHVHALVGAQQLASFNTMALAGLAEEEEATAFGVLGGAVIGTGAGVLWALQDPDPRVTLGFHSGAWWGFGLATLATGYAYKFDDLGPAVPITLAAGADLGAGLGAALPLLLPVTEEQIRMANAGGFIGAAISFAFVNTTSSIVWYTPHSVAAIVGGAGLAGGALGVVLATRLDGGPDLPVGASALRLDGPRLRLALPVPRTFAVPGGAPGELAYGAALLDQPF